MSNKDRINEMINYYERRAPWHDQYMEYSGNEMMEKRLKPIVIKVVPYITKKNIIEIACGTGNWTQVLARRAKHVLAIDSSPKSLEIAKDKLQLSNRITLDIADAYNLENINDRYDVAFTSDFFSHIPKKMINCFFDSMKTVLRPGGQVIILEMSNKDYFLEKFDCYVDGNSDLINTRQLPDGSITEVVKNFYSENELRELLKNHSSDIIFHNFEELKRWLAIFRIK